MQHVAEKAGRYLHRTPVYASLEDLPSRASLRITGYFPGLVGSIGRPEPEEVAMVDVYDGRGVVGSRIVEIELNQKWWMRSTEMTRTFRAIKVI